MVALVTKPDAGTIITEEDVASVTLQAFFDELVLKLNTNLLGAQVGLTSYTVATLPTVTTPGMIFVSDETGGAVLAFSDGTNWRRCTDRVIVS